MVTGDGRGKAPPPPTPQLESFLVIGLDQRMAENAPANRKVTANLAAVIAEAGVSGCDKSVGNLIYIVATKYPTNAQLDAALSFVSTLGPDSFDIPKFGQACGVGVVVSIE